MDEQELIQVNLQLPSSALDSLSRLAEQLRKLTAAVGRLSQPASASEEVVESGFFDPERFLALRQRAEEAAAREPLQEMAEAQAVHSEVLEQMQEPESAGEMEAAEEPARVETLSDEMAELPAPAGQENVMADISEEIPAVRPGLETQILDAPAVRMEPESGIPAAEETWAQTEERELPLPAVQAEPAVGAETPLGAGFVVTAQPEAPVSRWIDVTEELVAPGPAPLTAEAVSLAFQRDGRRYDNGFPLY